ncbi:MAG: hypothetical protein KDC79_03895 [Cyclobacteriaceae bacterium]|nr:hypothetical protein [Cyclobacteriaceae bacterium]
MAKIKATLLSAALIFLLNGASFAQCAMCRATLETNVNNGSEEQMAATLNFGIMYLFAAPYILVGVVGYLWYKQSRRSSSPYK